MATTNAANQLIEQITEAFRKVHYPGDTEIICHSVLQEHLQGARTRWRRF